jgi:hypothetical protein
MSSKSKDILMQDKAFLFVAAATAVLLSVPAFLMLLQIGILDPGDGYELLNWGPEDFLVMGILIFATGSAFVLGARRIKKNRALLALGLLMAFFLVWIELAVDGVSQLLGFIF